MSLGKEVAAALPYLRRFARAITGTQQSGDIYVRETLERLLENPDILQTGPNFRASLYRVFLSQIEHTSDNDNFALLSSSENEDPTGDRFASVPPIPKLALLLSTLEDFSISETAQILELSDKEAADAVQLAITAIDRHHKSKILIIEDELLIALQLQTIVESMGHSVVGVASTRREAVSISRRSHPDLILTDINLADGSSGIKAVDEITARRESLVIFVTAYPERLLTGNRPEPTYLITKPYTESTVRAAIRVKTQSVG